jgi:hypothetical protein
VRILTGHGDRQANVRQAVLPKIAAGEPDQPGLRVEEPISRPAAFEAEVRPASVTQVAM